MELCVLLLHRFNLEREILPEEVIMLELRSDESALITQRRAKRAFYTLGITWGINSL